MVGAEESSVMSFLNDDERDPWFIVILQFHTRLSNTLQLMLQDLQYTQRKENCISSKRKTEGGGLSESACHTFTSKRHIRHTLGELATG